MFDIKIREFVPPFKHCWKPSIICQTKEEKGVETVLVFSGSFLSLQPFFLFFFNSTSTANPSAL